METNRRAESLRQEIAGWEDLAGATRQLAELAELAKESRDDSVAADVTKQLAALNERYRQQELLVLLSGPYDEAGVFLSIHAGTGGVDAQDWAEKLERMYLRFAEKMGWRAEILDRNSGAEAGLKNDLIKISGRWAYGYLKSEAGVHRLVRISPFDAEAMRQTSFALVEIIPELPNQEAMEIKDEDLEYNFSRSGGPGGQNVNKTSTAVRLTHKPSGITVTAQTERSQYQNRERALAILKARLFAAAREASAHELKEIKGVAPKAEWGKQIRSYVLDPYQLVKDHRTNYETVDVGAVLDGQLLPLMESYLRHEVQQSVAQST